MHVFTCMGLYQYCIGAVIHPLVLVLGRCHLVSYQIPHYVVNKTQETAMMCMEQALVAL